MQQYRPYWHMKVARYSSSGSVPPNYVSINPNIWKNCHHSCIKLRKFVMIGVEVTSEMSKQQNEAITYFPCSNISHWELFLQNRSRELFPLIVASMFVKLKRNLQERSRYFGMKFLSLKYGKKKKKTLMFGSYL